MKRLASDALDGIVGQLRDEPYSEATHVRFVVGERTFHAHRWLVEMRMQKYAHSLKAGFTEGQRNEWVLPDCDPATFEHLHAYLYTDACPLFSPQSATAQLIDLWRLADELLFSRLTRECTVAFAARLDRARCASMLADSLETGFPPAIELVWQQIERHLAAAKFYVRLEWGRTLTLGRRIDPWAKELLQELDSALFEQDAFIVSAADQVRLADLFLHGLGLMPADDALHSSLREPALQQLVPLHELTHRSLLHARDAPASWVTDEVVVRALRHRCDYLSVLARTPRVVSRKPLSSPLEFMPLDPLLNWASGSESWTGFSPLRYSSTRLEVQLERPNGRNFWFVGDYPSVDFGFEFLRSCQGCDVELGLLATAEPKLMVTSCVIRVRDGAAWLTNGEEPICQISGACHFRVRVHRTSDKMAAAVFTVLDQTLRTTEFAMTDNRPTIELFLPAIRIHLAERGEAHIKVRGTRWAGSDRSPLADGGAQLPLELEPLLSTEY